MNLIQDSQNPLEGLLPLGSGRGVVVNIFISINSEGRLSSYGRHVVEMIVVGKGELY